MAIPAQYSVLVGALPETGEIPYKDLRAALVAQGKGRSLAGFHQARKDKVLFASFRNGALVVSRFPISEAPRA